MLPGVCPWFLPKYSDVSLLTVKFLNAFYIANQQTIMAKRAGVGKGAASTTSQTCVDPHCHPDGPLPLKIEPRSPFSLINHYALAHKYVHRKV